IEEPPLYLPYTEIECVRIQGNLGRARAPIYVWYAAGLVRIPARVNVHSGDLYEFLAEKLPVSGSRELPPVLARFCADQAGLYGADRVYTYRARQYRDTYPARAAMAIFGAIALVGLCWCLGGLLVVFLLHDKAGGVWVILSLFATVMGSAVTVGMWRQAREPRIRQWQKSGLVISPGGLAMIQGDMTGQLRWDELRDIRFRPKRGFFGPHSPHLFGIQLVVAG